MYFQQRRLPANQRNDVHVGDSSAVLGQDGWGAATGDAVFKIRSWLQTVKFKLSGHFKIKVSLNVELTFEGNNKSCQLWLFLFLSILAITAFHRVLLFWSDPSKCFRNTQTNSYCKSKIRIMRLTFCSLNVRVLNARTSRSVTYWFYRHAVSSCADMRDLTFHPPLPGRQEYWSGSVCWCLQAQLCSGGGWSFPGSVQHLSSPHPP